MIKLAETQDTQLPDGLYLVGVTVFKHDNTYDYTNFFEVIIKDMTESDSVIDVFNSTFPQYRDNTAVTTTIIRLKD